ncbi:dTDP-4-dehydrorhamnose 3,5-epimerase [Rubinisphaera brasiliensis]|uniref:dTDP-4-dehydrorhamnose 3,5-epimerase n=1 Tax=Rubinisphaera brasiliensis (strain ATCC 49424 / DSM 5305 / JCM 21570 / IAM 15109 / NBRC 103401 / IFAM 1448) TaxID=756272 RepID=F0SSE2_RUBBR|nr:dTDP-4-dehydrorhamnose 3,5-epimerase [Rubinisphaera brasiliensis]ADY59213.1 dTDP-4-dehydrorhamnose 3,5-epimerase [Rubinisphaera brasiliensis DSM 5305]
MQIETTAIADCLLITPAIHGDERGFFMEIYQQNRYAEEAKLPDFVQDNYSRSVQGTLRGLHYQLEQAQGKLVQVIRGEVFDVAVDLRRKSPTFGKHVAVRLNDQTRQQFYVPPGCAHGFYVVSESADFLYKCTDFYHPASERTLQWNDPEIGIDWPVEEEPILSAKDQAGVSFADCEKYE